MASSSSSINAFSCPICHLSYGRVEHLQRHLDSHNSARPFGCSLCGKSYRRRDVLSRHQAVCEARSPVQRQKAASQRRHSTRRACDRCVKQKRACSCTLPCQNCAAQNHRCTYPPEVAPRNSVTITSSSRRQDDISQDMWFLSSLASNPSMEPLDFDEALLDFDADLQDQLTLLNDRNPASRFDFLIQFSKEAGLAESFESTGIIQSLQQQQQQQLLGDPFSGTASQLTPRSFVGDAVADWTSISWQNDTTAAFSSYSDPLAIKTVEICSAIRRTVESKPDNSSISMDWSDITSGMSMQFFSSQSLRKFLDLYWIIYHPHWPCIHRPSFDPQSAPAKLLAGMALIGASLSPHLPDRQNARLWFNTVEEWVFSDPDLSAATRQSSAGTSTSHTSDNDEHYAKLRNLQAAYVVCIYQTWEGDMDSKFRIRRNRFTAMVSMVRKFGMQGWKHKRPAQCSQYTFDWQAFSRTEELNRILTFVFLLDSLYVTWNNLPPRIVLRELIWPLSYPESCFQADSAEDCLEKITAWQALFPNDQDRSLHSMLTTFCRKQIDEAERRQCARLGLLNLWALVKAFQVMAFNIDTTLGSCICTPEPFAPILTGLDNWKAVWTTRVDSGDDDTFDTPLADNEAGNVRAAALLDLGRRPGFWRHAAEYWLLVRLMVAKFMALSPMQEGDGGMSEGLERRGRAQAEDETGLGNGEEKDRLFRSYDRSLMVHSITGLLESLDVSAAR